MTIKPSCRYIFPFPSISLPFLILCGSLAGPSIATAQSAEEGAFVILVGSDTFAVENFSRRADQVDGEITGFAVGRLSYTMMIAPDAGVSSLSIRYWGPATDMNGPPVQAADLTVIDDTVLLQITTPPGIEEQRIASEAGAFLYINPSFVMTEQMVLYARARGGESVDFPVFMAQGEDTAPARVSSPTADSVTVTILGSPMQVVMDEQGRLATASIPTQGVNVVRTGRQSF